MKFSVFVLALFLLLLGPSDVFAQGCPGSERSGLPPCCLTFTVPSGGSDTDRTCVGPASRYEVTIYEFGFENDAGQLFSLGSQQSFDAASVSAGATVGSYISGASLPSGSYPYMRPIIGENFTVSADITTADNRRCVGTVTGANTDESLEACNENGVNPNYAPQTEHENCAENGRTHIRDGQAPFSYVEGQNLNFTFAFYVESAAVCVFPAGGTGDATPQVGWLNARISRN